LQLLVFYRVSRQIRCEGNFDGKPEVDGRDREHEI